MKFVSGRSAGSRGAVAHVRGATTGAFSGTVSLAAHGWASGDAVPDSTAVALLIGVAATIGALVSGLAPLRDTTAGLLLALLGGQVLGHLVMGLGAGHLHHGDAQLTPRMLLAHTLAACAAGILVRGAEAAYRIGTAVLGRLVPVRVHLPVLLDPAPIRTAYRDRVVLRILAAETLRTRGPPLVLGS